MNFQVMAEDGMTSVVQEKILTITIKRGWKQGTRITFPREGDQGPNNIPGQKRLSSLLPYLENFIHALFI